MRKSKFRAVPGKGGFIRTTLAPLNERGQFRFGLVDVTMLMVLVVGGLVAARFLVGN